MSVLPVLPAGLRWTDEGALPNPIVAVAKDAWTHERESEDMQSRQSVRNASVSIPPKRVHELKSKSKWAPKTTSRIRAILLLPSGSQVESAFVCGACFRGSFVEMAIEFPSGTLIRCPNMEDDAKGRCCECTNKVGRRNRGSKVSHILRTS